MAIPMNKFINSGLSPLGLPDPAMIEINDNKHAPSITFNRSYLNGLRI